MIAKREEVPVSPSLRYVIEIHSDDDAGNPRTEFDHVAEFWCWHRRYKLGDEKPRHLDEPMSLEGVMEYVQDQGDEVRAILPLYLYDHSGITMSTRPFSCPWDSGQVGWAFIRAGKVDEAGITDDGNWAPQVIQAEVQEYDMYLRGEVYGYMLARETLDEDGEVTGRDELESCWGFYGMDYCLEQARDGLASYRRWSIQERISRLKSMIRAGVPLTVRMEKLGPALS